MSLIDKFGNEIIIGDENTDDDVLFDGQHYYRIYKHVHEVNNPSNIEMISCTGGYMHAIAQKHLTNFERIGKYTGNEHLFACD